MSRTETESRKGTRDLKLGDVGVFVQVVRSGSITGAARTLAVGASHVSNSNTTSAAIAPANRNAVDVPDVLGLP